ncbi:peptidase inhibitor family I36 protein [Streptomyces sp. NPDC058272]|uniref:peptidase inhibitor family I36 protein n=1 Tax=unclassified Streptomyces TaxID=2593676 RepID=UPI0036E73BBF
MAAAAAPDAVRLPTVLQLALGDSTCPANYICIYEDVGYDGGGYGVHSGNELNDFRGIGFNDQMSSWINSTGQRYCWYPDINFSGIGQAMNDGYANSAVLPEHNDLASSLERC